MTQGRTPYNKLVRDRIPEIIRASGKECETDTLSHEAFQSALLDKLVEEAIEARVATRERLPSELADVLEVVVKRRLDWNRHEFRARRPKERSR
jgi:predicted house-cleaning noncanonical NTP pyrophosphatase (MazG superfamily)